MDMQTHSPLDQANDTKPIPVAAAECSDDDLGKMLIWAAEDRDVVERSIDRSAGIICSEAMIDRVNRKLRFGNYAPVPRERILDMAERFRQKAWEARNARRLADFEEAIGKRYAGCTLENYHSACPAQRTALAALRKYLGDIRENVTQCRGVVLFGPAGTGKDHLLAALAKEAILRGVDVEWRNGRDLCGHFRDAMKGDSVRTEGGLLRDLEVPEVLIISDPIPPAGSVTAYQSDVMFRLVDARYRAMKPIWATLNVTGGDEADSRLGAQIVDRLKHDALALFCDWPSHRKALA